MKEYTNNILLFNRQVICPVINPIFSAFSTLSSAIPYVQFSWAKPLRSFSCQHPHNKPIALLSSLVTIKLPLSPWVAHFQLPTTGTFSSAHWQLWQKVRIVKNIWTTVYITHILHAHKYSYYKEKLLIELCLKYHINKVLSVAVFELETYIWNYR